MMVIKRFIAGAVCQHCGGHDKTRAWEDDSEKLMRRECISCGYQEVIALEVSETSELVTRVNYADPVFDEDVRSVRILDDSDPNGS
ncbi:MAG: YheV family putative metal-binding protein [Pseudomonadota bacterium]|nr:YheV family putative metal-binding protein [Pseudomonadota bacterium]